MPINSDQVKGLIRALLAAIFGGTVGVWLLKHGIVVDDNFLTMAAGLLSGGLTTAWTVWKNTHASTVATAASIVPVSATSQALVGITDPIKSTP